ncbi:MAG TPA: DUF1501 domain-containing protein [Candidatus Acidoferrales bacterium]|nr:DUF1501 domain-containing protein [Candidatus Acidoferrales bacterium]
MTITRRYFLKGGGVAMLGFSAMPSFLTRALEAAAAPSKKVLVVIFQRGAMDGLNAVVPYGERSYYAMRPSIAIPAPNGGQNGALDLDGFFGLHPSLEPLAPLFRNKQLAIVHAAGSPDNSRSHFDAQDYMESGTPGVKSTEDGWLNRYLQKQPEESATPFRAVAMGQQMPRTLRGSVSALAIPDIKQFQVLAPVAMSGAMEGGFEALYAQTVDQALHGTGQETFEAVQMLKKVRDSLYIPENGADYPKGKFGQTLQQVAQLIKADIGVEVAFVDIGGWDHHVNEGGVQGQLGNILREFGGTLAAFHTDLGAKIADVTVVTMSEFGRTAAENGNRGTDHGHANCMFAFGGDVRGGRVYGKWPGLDRAHLYEGRDLAVTTDFRTVLGEVVSRHLGSTDMSFVFPGFRYDPRLALGLIRA